MTVQEQPYRYKDQEIIGMNISVNAISKMVYMPVCTSLEDIQMAAHEYSHLQKLKSYIIHGWLHKKDELEHSIKYYWLIRSGIAIKSNRIIIPLIYDNY